MTRLSHDPRARDQYESRRNTLVQSLYLGFIDQKTFKSQRYMLEATAFGRHHAESQIQAIRDEVTSIIAYGERANALADSAAVIRTDDNQNTFENVEDGVELKKRALLFTMPLLAYLMFKKGQKP